jgi:RNA polymerase sigma factor (sigma-70 family)
MPAEQATLVKRSDEQLLAAVRQGDEAAMGALFARHHRDIHALCARLVHDRDVADDVAQEVFVRVWRYGGSFRGRSTFRTWLYRLAYNACNDARRRSARWETPPMPDAAADSPSDELTDRHILLDNALRRLSPEQREVLVLSRFHDLGYDEIGRIIDCSPGAARVRLHRAMNELRQLCLGLEGRCT